MNGDNVACLDSLGVEYIPKEILKSHTQQKYHNKYEQNRIQANNSIMYGYLCIGFN